MKIMLSITWWQIEKKWKQWPILFSWATKLLQTGLQPWNLKMLAPWKENYNKPSQCIEKQRHHLANFVHIVKAVVSPVVMYVCESWTIKKAECWRTDAFELWRWRRLLRVPYTARKSNQSILKEINPEYSLEGLMLKLKLQYCGHPMQRTDSLRKALMLGNNEGRRRRGWQKTRWLDGIADSMDMSLRTGKPGVLQFMGSQRLGHDLATEQTITD